MEREALDGVRCIFPTSRGSGKTINNLHYRGHCIVGPGNFKAENNERADGNMSTLSLFCLVQSVS